MEELIKTYEDRLTNHAHTTAPGPPMPHMSTCTPSTSSVPSPPSQPTCCPGRSATASVTPCYVPVCHSFQPMRETHHTSCSGHGRSHDCSTNSSEIKLILESISKLKHSVEKVQEEIIDVVNSVDKLSTKDAQIDGEQITDASPDHLRPLYRNPKDIPDFEEIHSIETVQIHAIDQNDSVESVDILVPDIPPPNFQAAPSLNN